jgi:hypothetical protein
VRRWILSLSLIVCAAALCPAQTQRQRPASHTQAANELVETLNLQTVFTNALDEQTRLVLKGNPALAPYEGVMRQFFAKYMNWETVKPRFVALYADAFTEAELRETLAFYRTQTGKKWVALLPGLMKEAGAMGAQLVSEHDAELRQMIIERTRELEQQKKP